MDILDPELDEIDGVFFRIYETKDEEEEHGIILPPYVEEGGSDYCSDEEYLNVDVEVMENHVYRIKFHVASAHMPYIVGHRRTILLSLEAETRTVIKVPPKMEQGDVVVMGRSRRSVVRAYEKIEVLILQARSKQPFTHFVSLPMNAGYVRQRFVQFKEEVLESCGSYCGVSEELFQNPNKLHLTISTLVISDSVERAKAIEMLKRCKVDVIDPVLKEPLKISICGVEYMNDDPHEVNVLYAKVRTDDDGMLQKLCDDIVTFLAKTGYVENQYDRVKLHITLMNTRFIHSKSIYNDEDSKTQKKTTFDASKILKRFGNYEFGEITVRKMHLSQRYTTSKDDGYYVPSTVIEIGQINS